MPYFFQPGEKPAAAVGRIVAERVAHAIASLESPFDANNAGVHEARKSFKRIRALLKLCRASESKSWKILDRIFRDNGRRIATLRDHEAVVEAIEKIIASHQEDAAFPGETFRAARALLIARNRSLIQSLRLKECDPRSAVVAAISAAAEDFRQWRIPQISVGERTGNFRRTYRAGRRIYRHSLIGGGAHAFHEWRKRVKDHTYHLQLLEHCLPPAPRSNLGDFDRLAIILGDLQDLEIIEGALAKPSPGSSAFAQIQALAPHLSDEKKALREMALHAGRAVYELPP